MDVFQVAQRAVDLDRAREFYSWLLQVEPTGLFDPPGLLFFQVGATRLLLDRVAPSALVYLRVDDVRRTDRALRGARRTPSRPSRTSSSATRTTRSGPPGPTSGWRSSPTRRATRSDSSAMRPR